MASPDFILKLREKIGHDPLWLPGVRGVVFDAEGRVLLGERSDTGGWALITGILDPGEEPGPGLVREIFEETAVVAKIEQLLGVVAVGPVTFPNGDVCDFLNIEFIARHVSGTARVNDDESLAVGWFGVDELPPLRPGHLACIQRAIAFDGAPNFQR
ncbi:NUDIX domain-containing protein [Arthrobacter sp. H35-D1]|uniref:NUDIX hydrolase n=1 Tax=Arthrobacter sp. H35-D1 TaxID=3046202 RepID=UPI0024BB83EA|nr:NUDIX domain-containing protein [Arthrobacter sp. H35-D1]MDJ0312413.1 NUDIX domain-containing protein [Arthrobacter sp. H35-D1]